MPRPLHAIHTRNPTKTQNNFATLVGADLCVGPLRTCRFRTRAHTQVRPYRAGMVAFADHTSEPGGPPPVLRTPNVPLHSLTAGAAVFFATPNSVTRPREAEWPRALPAI